MSAIVASASVRKFTRPDCSTARPALKSRTSCPAVRSIKDD